VKAHLDSDGRMIAPTTYRDGLARREQLQTEIEKIGRQLSDPRRAERYVTAGAFDAWRMGAVRAKRFLETELKQLIPWLAARPEANDFRDAHRLLETIRQDDGLDGPEEIALVARLNERYPEHLQDGEGRSVAPAKATVPA